MSLPFYRPDVDNSLEPERRRLIQELYLEDGNLLKSFETICLHKVYYKYIECSQLIQYLDDDNIQVSLIQIIL